MLRRIHSANETNEDGFLKRSGEISARIGNEVMLDPKDFKFEQENIVHQ